MSDSPTQPCDLQQICSQRHWSIYWILIVASVAMLTARVLALNHGTPDDSPFFSANDRSRWCTIRALGDYNTYAIDRVIADGKNVGLLE